MPPKKRGASKTSSKSVKKNAKNAKNTKNKKNDTNKEMPGEMKPTDAEWLFNALRNNGNMDTVLINIQSAAAALDANPHNIACKISELRNRYGLNIAGTSGQDSSGSNDAASRNVGLAAADLQNVEVRMPDIERLAMLLRHVENAVTIHTPTVGAYLGTRPHNVSCKISHLRINYGLKLAGTTRESAAPDAGPSASGSAVPDAAADDTAITTTTAGTTTPTNTKTRSGGGMTTHSSSITKSVPQAPKKKRNQQKQKVKKLDWNDPRSLMAVLVAASDETDPKATEWAKAQLASDDEEGDDDDVDVDDDEEWEDAAAAADDDDDDEEDVGIQYRPFGFGDFDSE